jgi:bis(5'-nucleosyl)-tetraphosphatase (symmetrical)
MEEEEPVSIYAIGDIQGCYQQLRNLLQQIAFKPGRDRLWIAGDLVNRGPESLETLRYLYSLRKHCTTVLGNHDLHLLAVAHSCATVKRKDSLQPVLKAHDKETLLSWLQRHPLLHYDQKLGFAMVHAGIPPHWSMNYALKRAHEVEQVLRSPKYKHFLRHMYGNEPSRWHPGLQGMERLRMITNYFTRMRFCNSQGRLNLECKLGPEKAPKGYIPWYEHRYRLCCSINIIFGHWAALEGKAESRHVYALDTGCVWGKHLTAMNLKTHELHSVPCNIFSH